LMPSEDDFPFSVRVTADTLSSSGSSSMAAVCAASLALKTAGVPISSLAAGISIGLVSAAPPQLGGLKPNTSSSDGQQQQQGGSAGSSGIDASSYSSLVAVDFGRQQTAAERSSEQADSSSSSSSSSDSGDEAGGSSSSSDEEAASSDSSSGSGSGRQVLDSSYGPALLLTDIQGIEDHLGDMDFKVG
jgi:polyribonucleotide nucleotidyltransferase